MVPVSKTIRNCVRNWHLFNTAKFEAVLQKVAKYEEMPNGSYLIRVTGETFEETEVPEYNSAWDNNGGKVYLGGLDKTE